MLIFGHAGITVGAAVTFYGIGNYFKNRQRKGESSRAKINNPEGKASGINLSRMSENIDLRILVLGSLLPDIIDKPFGRFFFRETFQNGRIFSHTLIFLIIIVAVAMYFYIRRHTTWPIVLSFGVSTHLVFDGMWMLPETLFWPLSGFTFPRVYHPGGWFTDIFKAFVEEPLLSSFEIAGAVVLVWLAVMLIRKKKLYVFIRTGRI